MTNLSTLLTLADSRLPTGGHVHSGGVEEAVASGLVVDLDDDARHSCVAGSARPVWSTASIAAAVHAGELRSPTRRRRDGRPNTGPAARRASRAQGRGLLRLARTGMAGRTTGMRSAPTPHLPVAAGAVGAASGLAPRADGAVVVYTTMTGSATAAQRLLALDPGDVAAVTFALSELCDQTAAEARDGAGRPVRPLLDVLAERHSLRDRPLFVS